MAILFAQNLRNLRNTGSIAQNMLLQVDQNWQFQHKIKQQKVYSKINVQINYDYADWLLLVSKSLNWGQISIKQKLEIWKFKIDAKFL